MSGTEEPNFGKLEEKRRQVEMELAQVNNDMRDAARMKGAKTRVVYTIWLNTAIEDTSKFTEKIKAFPEVIHVIEAHPLSVGL